jgi:MFS family permease
MRVSPASRALAALVAEGFFMRLGFGILSFTIPLYARHLGLNLAETGALIALTGIVKVALKPAAGWLADQIGAKRGLVASLGLRSLVSFLFAFAMAPWHLYALRTVHGLSTSMRDPTVNALIAESGDEKAMGSAFAWYFTAKSLANALGKAIAGTLLAVTASNYTVVFLVTWVVSSLTLPAVILFVPGARRVQPERPNVTNVTNVTHVAGVTGNGPVPVEAPPAPTAQPAPASGPSLQRRVSSLVGLGFLISVTASMIDRFYPILATEVAHMSPARAGLVYLASAFVALVAGPLFGWASDRFGRRPTVVMRTAANAGSSLLYLFSPTPTGFTVGKLLDDGGRAGFRPAWGALKADVSNVDKRQRARLMGVMDVGDDLGDVLGPIAGGFLWGAWGVTGLLLTRVALAGLTELVAAGVLKPRAPAPVPLAAPEVSS